MKLSKKQKNKGYGPFEQCELNSKPTLAIVDNEIMYILISKIK